MGGMSTPLAAVLILLLLPGLVLAQDRITGRSFATRSPVLARHGMAATSQPLATQVALDVLKAGGSALDAAIAANAMLGLVEPTGCGVGGDLFAIVWDAQAKELVGLNASGRSPRSLDLEQLRTLLAEQDQAGIPPYGPLPVSVPGCVDGWFELHGRFGKLPMAEVLAPAIRYAEEGAPISEVIAHYWAIGVERLGKYPNFLDTFAPGGRAPAVGEVFANPGLASTYRALAEGGRDAFYRGEVARTIAGAVQELGGYLTEDDLEQHTSEWVEPVSTTYRGHELWELPPNGQGIAALQMLNVLEDYDLAAMGYGSADYAHVFLEAKKLAFADRARFYADPAMADVPVAELISKEYAARRRARIDMEHAAEVVRPGDPAALEEGDTVYLCTADSAGNMVSLIQSNYRGMGSGVTPPGLGFCLQDRGQLFALDAEHPNVYAPGKRPFHTIIPAFLTRDGEPLMAFGVMGGATQPQGHVQIVVNLVDFGMNVQEAGDAPRLLHQGSSQPTGEEMTDGGRVSLESGYAAWDVVRALRDRGHDVEWNVGSFGGYQGILWDAHNGVYHGASESRKDGHAAGY
jgi:gamma-glutamyltranspeptidase/glutathione hydrolase